jgi:hypothetical protein
MAVMQAYWQLHCRLVVVAAIQDRQQQLVLVVHRS